MQLEEECKNMENDNIVTFKFLAENEELSLDLDSPNFSNFVKKIINKNYEVSDDNILVSLPNSDEKNIDITTLKDIVIEIHKNYYNDLEEFYRNIESEVSTYYDDEDQLLKEIENFVKQEKSKDIPIERFEVKSIINKESEESKLTEDEYSSVG